MNAAVWLGTAVFFTFGAAPTVFSPEMKRIFGDYYSGVIAQQMLSKYFIFHYVCGAIALGHFLAEWLYLGKTLERFMLGLLGFILVLGLLGGVLLQPKLRTLNHRKYKSPHEEVQTRAASSFRAWHGVSQVMNLFVGLGLIIYVWRIVNPPDVPRFISSGKFRG